MKFESKPSDQALLEAALKKYQVSADLITYLEDEGDTTTHDNRNKLTVSMLEVALKDDDYDANQVWRKKFLSELFTYFAWWAVTVGLSSNEALIMVT